MKAKIATGNHIFRACGHGTNKANRNKVEARVWCPDIRHGCASVAVPCREKSVFALRNNLSGTAGRHHRYLLTAFLAVPWYFLPAAPASAQCADTGGTNIVCATDDTNGFSSTTTINSLTVDNGVTVDETAGGVGLFGVISIFAIGGATPGVLVDVINNGTILDSGAAGAGILVLGNVGGNVLNTGSVTAGLDGFAMNRVGGNFTNSGTITATGDNGVFIFGSILGDFVNSNTVQGNDFGVRIDNRVFGSVTNTGTVTGTTADAFDAFNGINGSFFNSGTMSGALDGVDFASIGGNFVNSATGTIVGAGENGVEVDFGDISGNFENAGTIRGVSGAVDIVGSVLGSVTNTGTLTATGGDGFDADVTVAGNFYNSGTITGTSEGVDIGAITGTFTNDVSGLISAGDNGVELDAGTVSGGFFNRGSILGDNDGSGAGAGVFIVSGAGNAGTFQNDAGATITGNRGFVSLAGSESLLNIGTITGRGGVAIGLGAGDDRLELHPTSVITGTANGGADTDTFVLGGSGTGTFDVATIGAASQYRNFETFIKEDASTWTLTGTNPGTDWTVTGGIFVNNAVLGMTSVTGGTVMGIGSFTGLALGNGSFLAPGNSIGTLTVNGDFALNGGSTFRVEVTNTAADQVIATGDVTINNATLTIGEVTGTIFSPSVDTSFTIVDNQGTGAVQGSGFTTVVESLAFANATVTVAGGDGNDVVVFFSPDLDFTRVAQTRNQHSVALALGGGFFGGSDFSSDKQEVLNALVSLTDDGARSAFDMLSGEIHAATLESILTQGSDVSNALARRGAGLRSLAGPGTSDGDLDRSAVLGFAALDGSAEQIARSGLTFPGLQSNREREGARFGLGTGQDQRETSLESWATGIGRVTRIGSTTGAGAIDQAMGGFIGGVDVEVAPDLRIGFAVGYQRLHTEIDKLVSKSDLDAATLAAYVSHSNAGFHLFGSAAYTHHFIDTERRIAFGGLSRTAEADYDANQATMYAEGGYTFTFGSSFLQPVLAARGTVLSRESFRETGAGTLNLSGFGETDSRIDAIAGVRVSTSRNLGGVVIIPQANAYYTRSFGEVQGDAEFLFSGGGPSTSILSSSRGRDALSFGAGLSVIASDRISGFADYQATFTNNTFENRMRAGFTIKF